MTPTQLATELSQAGQNRDWQRVMDLYRQILGEFPDFYDMWMQYWYARALVETGYLTQGLEIMVLFPFCLFYLWLAQKRHVNN